MARDAEAQLQRAGDDAEWLRGFAASQAAGERLVSEMVISGHHSPVFEAICDSLATCLQAARAHIAGAGHATPDTGDLFNRTLETFIRASAS
jgi:hypothetical protein